MGPTSYTAMDDRPGEGAHDDGAGIVHAIETIHLFEKAGYKPKRTIRCVLYMNEENGVGGGKIYARAWLPLNGGWPFPGAVRAG